MSRLPAIVSLSLAGICVFGARLTAQEGASQFSRRIEQAVKRSIPLLEKASAETARQRKCFNCHGQSMPVFALVEARDHGFQIDAKNLKTQLDHTYGHLERSKNKYEDGKGTGGQVDTAGWALWALEVGDRQADEVTDAVISYLLVKQKGTGLWKCTSNRPPSEASSFATSYLALRGLDWFGSDSRDDEIEKAKDKAAKWFNDAKPKDTEDRVFEILSLPYIGLENRTDQRVETLKGEQRSDGGWSQLPELDSDAYATATVLYALAQAGVAADDHGYHRGLEYLLDQQQGDGSWHVTTRSDPFQEYFESGYPHDDDQFISTTAACWATVALLHALPSKKAID